MGIRTISDQVRNEPGLVDRYIGSAYDVVKAVYDNLDKLSLALKVGAIPLYATYVEGVAATPEGGYFAVIGADGSDTLSTIYRIEDGNVITVNEYTSADGIEELIAAASVTDRARANHTGTQAIATVLGLQDELTELGNRKPGIGLGQAQGMINKLLNNVEDLNIVTLGDSTSTGNAALMYRAMQMLSAQYPTWNFKNAAWNTVSYNAQTDIVPPTGGPRTANHWNASINGGIANRFAGSNFKAAVVDKNPDVIFLNYGHNGSTTAERQLDFFDELAMKLAQELPHVPVILIGQNPTQSDNTSSNKQHKALMALASRNDWGFISVHDAFLQSGVPLATLMFDEVHPNDAGYTLGAQTIVDACTPSRGSYGYGTRGYAIPFRTYSSPLEFSDWIAANVTVTHNTVNFETTGRAITITNTTPGLGYLYRAIAGDDEIKAVQGKYLVATIKQRVVAGNDGSSGRVDLHDNTGFTSAVGVLQDDGFIYFTVRRKIAANATYVHLYIYPNTEVGITNSITIERVSVAIGISPIDFLPPAHIWTPRLLVEGNNSEGIGTLFNAAAGGGGLRFIPTRTGNPATEYTTDFSDSGFHAKATGNAFKRYSVTGGGFFFGHGTIAQDIAIDRQHVAGDGWIRCNGSKALVPADNGIQYLGDASQAWRALIVKDGVYVNGLLVLGARKTGWTVDTGTAKRTANATYVPGAGLTFGAAYVQAEHTAIGTRLTLIENALRDFSQTVKALKDDLFNGIIGT